MNTVYLIHTSFGEPKNTINFIKFCLEMILVPKEMFYAIHDSDARLAVAVGIGASPW